MEHGKVVSVNYKEGVVYCDVQPLRNEPVYRNVPVLKPHSAFVFMPKQDMKVAMDSLDDGTRFIQDVISREDENPEDMREGEIAIHLDSGTQISFEKKNNGDFDLHLEASGDVFINGTKQ